ncbi:ABC transporter ATP-binding protein [Rhodoligotrophos ferricapiens]|uniref:ABC transporter ATP-binding protein n=1 Tax=Rhodoligotrophos ferricapiens TaxID=3069264 RepID=UPI00315C876F
MTVQQHPATAETIASPQAMLRLRDLSCAFGTVRAVDGVSLDIAPGELVSLLGPSGCGKTTMLRMIAGFLTPTAGHIEMGGQVISGPNAVVPPERRQMSMIFQSYAIWPNMTVAENVAFGLKLRHLDRATRDARVREMLEVVKMAELADRYPGELSGGQQQRVALARAMVIQPRVLLLDEPLSNLDATLREEMRFEIRRLHDTFRFTTVYVTHDQGEAMVASDRIAVMNKGRIEQVAPPYELYNRPRTRFVAGFIGRTNLVSGECSAEQVVFEGFSMPRVRFPEQGRNLAKTTLFSLRPQSIALYQSMPSSGRTDGECLVPARIAQRTYLGETWDYVADVNDGRLQLKLSALPNEVVDVGADVWLGIDPAQMAAVS